MIVYIYIYFRFFDFFEEDCEPDTAVSSVASNYRYVSLQI